MKDHFIKELKENLNTNEGIERVSFDEVKLELSEEKEKEEERNPQFTKKKKDSNYHDIKNFDNVISHKNKFAMEAIYEMSALKK